MTTPAIRLWYALLVVLISAVVIAGVSIQYANHVGQQATKSANRTARESEAKWCGLVTTLDDAYRDTPPQTPAGRKVAADIHRLRLDFGCP